MEKQTLPDATGGPVGDSLPPHVLEVWAILLLILATILVMSLLMFGPAVSFIVYRVWKSPPQREVWPEG